MDPIQVLMDEHREIEKVLAAAEVCARRLTSGGDVTRADAHDFVRFIREYADALHHGKEEDMLFQEMMSAGMPREAGPLGVMFAEHDEGRRFVGIVADAAAGEGPLDDEARKRIAGGLRGYSGLLHEHIAKEDTVLYEMARHMLPPAVMEDLGRRFELFAENDERARETDALLALAGRLAERFRP